MRCRIVLLALLASAFAGCTNAAVTSSTSDEDGPRRISWEFRWELSTAPNETIPGQILQDAGWQPLETWADWPGEQHSHDLWLRGRLPNKISRDYSMFLDNNPDAMEFFIDGRRILSTGDFQSASEARQIDPRHHRLLDIPTNAAGSAILLRASHRGPMRLALSEPVFGAERDLLLHLFRTYAAFGFLGIIFLFVGVTSLTVSPMLRRGQGVVDFGLLCICFGWLSFAQTGFLTFVVEWPVIRIVGMRLALLTIGIFLPRLLAVLLPDPGVSNTLRQIAWIQASYAVCATLIYLTGLIHLSYLMRMNQFLQIAIGLSVTAVLLWGFRRGLREARWLLIFGILPMSAMLVGANVVSWFTSGLIVAQLLPVGFGFFLATVTTLTIRRLTTAYESQGAAEAARQSEARFRALLQNAADMVFVLDSRGRYLYASPACIEVSGLAPEQLYGTMLIDRVHPDDRQSVLKNFELLCSTPRETFVFEYRHKRNDGAWTIHEARASNQLANSDVRGIVANVRDVTQRRNAELERDRLLERFQLILDKMPIGCLLNDTEFRFTYWNPEAERIFGYSFDEVRGKHPFSVITPTGSQASVGQAFETLRHQGGTIEARGENITKDGRLIMCDWRNVSLFDAESQFIGVLSMCQNVTEQEKAVADLRDSEQRFQMVADATGDAIYDFDFGSPRAWYNRHYIEQFGETPSESTAKDTWLERIHPADRDRMLAKLSATLGGSESSWTTEYRLKMITGEYADVIDRGYVIRDAAGAPSRYIGAITDITAVKQAEAQKRLLESQMLQSQKLESLGILSGGIAHDFNNLLVGILGNAGHALMNCGPDSPLRPVLEEIERTGQHAADLCNQLLAYSGRGKFHVQTVAVNELLREMHQLLAVSIKGRAVLTLQLADQLPTIDVDVAQLRQVIVNLMINAAEAQADHPGQITLRTAASWCETGFLRQSAADDELPAGHYVAIEVSDNGRGMTPETRDRIFDPFFTTKMTGRGLGLAAVLGIVRGHRGTIRVDTELGKGSVFRLYFPASNRPAEPVVKPTTSESTWRGLGTVLLVDDDVGVRSVANRVLQTAGFTVVTADDGVDGIEKFKLHQSDICIVVLDMTMPRMSGEESFLELRRIDPTVRILLTSGYSEQETSERFAGCGRASFIQKPWRPKELIEQIRRLLDSNPIERPS